MFIEPNFCTKHSSWSEQAVSFNKQRVNINCMHVILVAFDRVEILGGNLVCVCVWAGQGRAGTRNLGPCALNLLWGPIGPTNSPLNVLMGHRAFSWSK